ncbi:hypothetical protein [Erythrobacter dokdonensis]|uniref:Uncharacterized protein n=1 Tax=Erythrobacter dokdonensis DSW-74 TaxID=1300349 RepID=A0A1A7BET3_9SPHN|nr:hypothetical protein [Erythrobacter dokdonensis]MEE4317612.1 hypothetical protein [Erythrobacter sp.]OBV10994.1 hypothetical protein I603_1402 [Erythrobacter dokdonensis DSW-74]
MSLPFGMGIFGLVVCAVFLFTAIRELRRNRPGHLRNAAMIHLAMVSMFVPFCLYIIAAYDP